MERKKYRWKLVLGVLCIIVVIGAGVVYRKNTNENMEVESNSNEVTQENQIQEDKTSEEDSAQDASVPDQTNGTDEEEIKLEIGETEQKGIWTQTSVYPNNIDDTFVIDVCLPDDYDESKVYPVVYLTDCYWRREDYASIKALYESGKTREFILIGIGYPDNYDFDTIRQRDLIEDPEAFLKMIMKGVIPYVESCYKVDAKERTFCGASCGGYFMLYSLFQSDGITKNAFKNYVLASPMFNLRSYGIYLADYEDEYYRRCQTLNANVYMTVGGDEGQADMKRPSEKFVKRLEKRGYTGLNLTYKEYEGKEHYTVWVPSLLDGLQMYLAK